MILSPIIHPPQADSHLYNFLDRAHPQFYMLDCNTANALEPQAGFHSLHICGDLLGISA
jgi:hypothetical protein